jgi:hypothetical protein
LRLWPKEERGDICRRDRNKWEKAFDFRAIYVVVVCCTPWEGRVILSREGTPKMKKERWRDFVFIVFIAYWEREKSKEEAAEVHFQNNYFLLYQEK